MNHQRTLALCFTILLFVLMASARALAGNVLCISDDSAPSGNDCLTANGVNNTAINALAKAEVLHEDLADFTDKVSFYLYVMYAYPAAPGDLAQMEEVLEQLEKIDHGVMHEHRRLSSMINHGAHKALRHWQQIMLRADYVDTYYAMFLAQDLRFAKIIAGYRLALDDLNGL